MVDSSSAAAAAPADDVEVSSFVEGIELEIGWADDDDDADTHSSRRRRQQPLVVVPMVPVAVSVSLFSVGCVGVALVVAGRLRGWLCVKWWSKGTTS